MESDAVRAKALRQREEWVAAGARNVSLYGTEQKKRVLESRAERLQSRRNAALANKQEWELKRNEAKERMNKELAEKRLRLERTKESLPTATSLAEARDFFLKQKRDAAAAVRKSEKGWESERKRESKLALERAAQHRAHISDGRKAISSNRADVIAARATEAKEIKARLHAMESERQRYAKATAQSSKSAHEQLYQRRFVSDEEAEEVYKSEWGALMQRVRAPVSQGPTSGTKSSAAGASVAAQGTASSRTASKQPAADTPKRGTPKQAVTQAAAEVPKREANGAPFGAPRTAWAEPSSST